MWNGTTKGLLLLALWLAMGLTGAHLLGEALLVIEVAQQRDGSPQGPMASRGI